MPPPRSSTASTTTQFPIDVFQTGSGTSSNMNMNEVLATLAAAGRASRSTPTTTSTPASPATTSFPTVDPRRRSGRQRSSDLVPALEQLATSLEAKAVEFARRREVRPHAPDGRHAR